MAKITFETRDKREKEQRAIFSCGSTLENNQKFELIHEVMNKKGYKKDTLVAIMDVMETIVGEVQSGGKVMLHHADSDEPTELQFIF